MIEERVYLRTNNIHVKQRSKKLNNKSIKLFKVKRNIKRLSYELLYIFVMNQDNLTSATSADTAILTSAVTTSPSSQKSVNCTNSLTLKQLVAAMSMN